MRKQQKSSIAAMILGLIFLILVGGVAFVFTSSMFERDVPQIALRSEERRVGKEC